jgi:hypothetical protein
MRWIDARKPAIRRDLLFHPIGPVKGVLLFGIVFLYHRDWNQIYPEIGASQTVKREVPNE